MKKRLLIALIILTTVNISSCVSEKYEPETMASLSVSIETTATTQEMLTTINAPDLSTAEESSTTIKSSTTTASTIPTTKTAASSILTTTTIPTREALATTDIITTASAWETSNNTIDASVTNTTNVNINFDMLDETILSIAISYVEDMLKTTFDDYSIDYESGTNILTIKILENGIASYVTYAAIANNVDLVNDWKILKDEVTKMSLTTREYFGNIYDMDVNVAIYFINDLNKDNILLSVLNGVVLYNVLVTMDFSTTTEPAVSVAITNSGETIGQKNALKTAQSYLDFSHFSYKGLIEQLEYEKYTHEEAVFAADNCGADWYEQAAITAESYLSFMSFSRNGLIDQLEYEGFTREQAIYGVEQNGY